MRKSDTRPVDLALLLGLIIIVASTWTCANAGASTNDFTVDDSDDRDFDSFASQYYTASEESGNDILDTESNSDYIDPGSDRITLASNHPIQPTPVWRGRFVQARGQQFVLNGKRLFVNGANMYYLMTLGSYPEGRRLVTEILRESAGLGVTVVRIWAFADGDANYNLQTRPGVYTEAVFQGLDYAVAEAKKVGIRLILSFVNNYADYGGRKQYATWAQRYAGKWNAKEDDFYTDGTIRQWYRNHIRKVITRVNTYTRVAYRNEPAIFAWELMNEPRCESDKSGNVLQRWIQEMARFVKSLDRNHMLEVGLEGFYSSQVAPDSIYSQKANPGHPSNYASQFGTDYVRNNLIPGIDFATVHSYPDSWLPNRSEYDRRAFMALWIRTHISDAKYKLNKPVLFAEYGKSDRTPGYNPSNRYNDMADMFNAVYASARSGGPAAGAMVWHFVPKSLKYNLADGYGIVISENPAIATLMHRQSARMARLR